MPREATRQAVMTNEADHISQILSTQQIRTAAAQFHVDQIDKGHSRDPFDCDRFLWRYANLFRKHKEE